MKIIEFINERFFMSTNIGSYFPFKIYLQSTYLNRFDKLAYSSFGVLKDVRVVYHQASVLRLIVTADDDLRPEQAKISAIKQHGKNAS